MLAQPRQRAALVAPHQAGVADNVSGQDRRQFALLTGQWNFSTYLQRIVEDAERLGNLTANPNLDPNNSMCVLWTRLHGLGGGRRPGRTASNVIGLGFGQDRSADGGV
jgi:hypothetical protein